MFHLATWWKKIKTPDIERLKKSYFIVTVKKSAIQNVLEFNRPNTNEFSNFTTGTRTDLNPLPHNAPF